LIYGLKLLKLSSSREEKNSGGYFLKKLPISVTLDLDNPVPDALIRT
jgi:hypothetical protein